MSCGICSEKTKAGASATTGAPVATGAARSVAQQAPLPAQVVRRCEVCGQFKGLRHVCPASDQERDLWRLNEDDFKAYTHSLRTPDGKFDREAFSRAHRLREGGAQNAVLKILAGDNDHRMTLDEMNAALGVQGTTLSGAVYILNQAGILRSSASSGHRLPADVIEQMKARAESGSEPTPAPVPAPTLVTAPLTLPAKSQPTAAVQQDVDANAGQTKTRVCLATKDGGQTETMPAEVVPEHPMSDDEWKAQMRAMATGILAPLTQPSPTLPAKSAVLARPFSANAPEVRAFIGLLYDENQARYAQQYAEYLARERDEPARPRQVSDASAQSIRYRLGQMAKSQPPTLQAKSTAPTMAGATVIAEGNRSEVSTQVAPSPIPQQAVAPASRVAAAPPPFNASDQTVQDYLAQLNPVQREYAQRYAAYAEQGRVGKEPSILPRQISHARAQSIRSRINQMASERFVQGAAPTRLATPIAQPSGAASQVAAPTLPAKSPTQDNGVGDNVVSRCDKCGQWKGPSHVCAKSETESAVCRMEDKEWRAYQKTLKTPDGKPDHKALARALHLRESGAEAELLGALVDAGPGRLRARGIHILNEVPIPEAVANGALRRLREKGLVSERDGEIALLSVAKSVEPGRASLHPSTPLRGNYPPSLDTSAKRALFEALGNNEQLALNMDAAIRRVKHDDWRGHLIKERDVRYAILDHLNDDEALANRIFELAKSQSEY
jgi:hypothetical protein